MKLKQLFSVAVLTLAPALLAADAPLSGSLDLRVRDSVSGRAVQANITAISTEGRTASSHTATANNGRASLQLSEARYKVSANAAAFLSLRTELQVQRGSKLPVTLWLDPAEPAPELRPETVRAQLRRGYALLHGHVFDETTGDPVANAPVRLETSGLKTSTDRRGYFSLQVPTFRFNSEEGEVPEQDDVIVEVEGFQRYAIRNTLLLERNDTHFIIDLQRGSGRSERDDEHKIIQHGPDGDHPHESGPADHTANSHQHEAHGQPVGAFAPATAGMDSVAAQAVTVPTSIRVGFTCSCATCSSVQVFSMETYVKRGLNDEWIASWHLNSLRSGAVAYRSFGSWHIANPKSTNYDICSSTCCQVNDSDTSLATDGAANDTAGVVLVRSGLIFRSEYASENNSYDDPADGLTCNNNDKSCGNGSAGSPANSWPCLSDSVCTGKGCYGHGRGMCQWGSQRWASTQAKDWRWIVDHYYNNNGAPSGLRSAFRSDVATEVIVDNATSGRFTASANWLTSSYSTQRYGADYRYANPEPVSDASWFKVNVPAAGSYEVYAWYPASTGYNSSTPFVIVTSGGNITKTVNQQLNGGAWFSLGTYTLNAGDYNLVGVSRWTSSAGYVIADAVKIVSR